MRRGLLLIGLFLASSGCAGGGDQDAAPVFDAVLKREFPGAKKDMSLFVFVEGKDPSPELLRRLRESWPGAQPGSQVGQGQAERANFSALMWLGRDDAEVNCTISNGMDGRGKHFKLARKNGAWVVQKAETTAES